MSLLYLGQTWSAWVHSLCTDMRQCWWWWDDMGDVSGVRPSWELRSWHSRHPPSRPGRQPPSVCGKFQTEPTALYIVYYVLLVLHYIVGPGKHNNQPDLFWLLSCSNHGSRRSAFQASWISSFRCQWQRPFSYSKSWIRPFVFIINYNH